ncbi:MAG: DUF3558 domain-containing protein [Rhodococcus sp.]|nr:DUF3558 domain-containing protein [Rhodococcus sp. (in: high G+C Gram-positive bacteria)]
MALSTVLLAGCGASDPTLAQDASAAESATRVPRVTDDSGRPPVTFDPCLDIPDNVIAEAGYDPASKHVSEYPLDDYTFLGCDFRTAERKYSLTLLSGNVTFAEESEKTADYAKPLEINGRHALLKFREYARDECAYSLETNYGVLIILRGLEHDLIGPAPQEEWCAGLEDTVRLIEPLLADE